MKKSLHMIGNAHIDPVWLWTLPEGLAEIKATFRSALDRMLEFDGYIFTSACASYYKWIEENEPGMFEEIRLRVDEGRWVLAGGMWVQPDCNIPCGEAFARHLLYSQHYFQEKFGKAVKVGYNVDSFGHNGMLPQLLSQSEIQYYIYQRPNSGNENPSLPENIFWWESPDGSRVLTYRLPLAYCDANINEHDLLYTEKLSQRDSLPYMYFYGVGNHGGGPSIEAIQAVEKLVPERALFSSPDKYFEELEKHSNIKDLRVLKNKALLHHASGCYSANSEIKMLNRIAENRLIAAEKSDVLACLLTNRPAKSRTELRRGWDKVMFNQFHDILAGCCLREAYDSARFAFGSACDTADEVHNAALQKISWNINTFRKNSSAVPRKNGFFYWDTAEEGSPLVVFNPHSFPVRRPVTVTHSALGVTDKDGNPVPVQQIRSGRTNGKDRYSLIFIADIPAFGYSTYYIFPNPSGENLPFKNTNPVLPSEINVSTDGLTLENNRLILGFDSENGCVGYLADKKSGRIWSGGGFARGIVIDNRVPDTWAHNIFEFREEIGSFSEGEVQVLENGPLRAVVRLTSRYGKSVLRQDFILYENAETVEVKCRLMLDEALVMVKLAFPTTVSDGKAVYSMPYGFLSKEPNGQEEPAQSWIDVNDGAAGVALINNGKYSFDVLNGEMRMIAARSCAFADHYGERDGLEDYQDLGWQEFTYAIYPHENFIPDEISRFADVISQELAWIPETHHMGALPVHYEGIRVSEPNITVSAVKFAEDSKAEEQPGGDVILRCCETRGAETEARIDFVPRGAVIKLKFRPQEIKTIRIREDGSWREENILEK